MIPTCNITLKIDVVNIFYVQIYLKCYNYIE